MKPTAPGSLASGIAAVCCSPPAAAHYSRNHAAGRVSQVFTYDTTATVMDDGWDPATEYSDGIIAMSQMYETLTRYDAAAHQVEPLLATSWSSADGGKTWTFTCGAGCASTPAG